jgi:hypothetical protein
VQPIGTFQEKVAAIVQLVRETRPDYPTAQPRARLDQGHDDREMRIREPRAMAPASLDDVRGALCVAELGLE